MKKTKSTETPIVNTPEEGNPFVEPILKNPEPGHIPVLRQLGIALFLLVFAFGTTYVGTIMALMSPKEVINDVAISAKLAESTATAITKNPFDTVRIEARSAFVWDVREERILFNKNADEVLPLASITKLMTALVAYELLGDESKIDISVDAIRTDGDSGLSDGEVFSLKDLTVMVLISSSNDGAAALAQASANAVNGSVDPNKLFVHAMNLRADELGLTNTKFKNPTGLDISETEAGAVSSARDVAMLLEYIIKTYPTVVSLTTENTARVYNENGAYHDVENTNSYVKSINGLMASKTGYTELAGGNLAVAFDVGLNRPIVVVVLGSSFDGRFADVQSLVNSARSYIAEQPK